MGFLRRSKAPSQQYHKVPSRKSSAVFAKPAVLPRAPSQQYHKVPSRKSSAVFAKPAVLPRATWASIENDYIKRGAWPSPYHEQGNRFSRHRSGIGLCLRLHCPKTFNSSWISIRTSRQVIIAVADACWHTGTINTGLMWYLLINSWSAFATAMAVSEFFVVFLKG